MATAVNPINQGYGRSLASLRRLVGLSQDGFCRALAQSYGDEYRWAQATLSAIESGKRPLQADEIEVLVLFFMDHLVMDEEEVRRRLRPHHLRLVGEGQPESGSHADDSKPELTVTPISLPDLEGQSRSEAA